MIFSPPLPPGEGNMIFSPPLVGGVGGGGQGDAPHNAIVTKKACKHLFARLFEFVREL